jgi:NAD(P)-dependent dehydrogenase (short-subunit alcohol dehydrogenase family)
MDRGSGSGGRVDRAITGNCRTLTYWFSFGRCVAKELIAAGHQVLGLCRSDEKAAALAAAGAEVYRGSTSSTATR